MDRTTSSVTTPPALRMMWASPCARPNIWQMSMRLSMHATMARWRRGPACRDGLLQRHIAGVVEREDGDAVVAAIGDVEPIVSGVQREMPADRLAGEALRQCGVAGQCGEATVGVDLEHDETAAQL